MLWSVGRTAVPAEISERLQMHAKGCGMTSTLWLNQVHAKLLFDVTTYKNAGVEVEMSRSMFRSLPALWNDLATPQRCALAQKIPPKKNAAQAQILTRREGQLLWTTADPCEIFIGTMFADSMPSKNELLFVSGELLSQDSIKHTKKRTCKLFNAQETSNPFAIDRQLVHTDLDGNEFGPDIAMSLTSLTRQFEYRSVRWITEQELALRQLRPRLGESSHVTTYERSIPFVAVDSLPADLQTVVRDRCPRFLLGKARPHFKVNGSWQSVDKLRLCLKGWKQTSALWLSLDEAKQLGVDGPTVNFTGSEVGRFYNASQLEHVC